ncbi:MAG: biopolymer transporter ExbD [Candidatus Zixiibacteriota bacterium]
MAGDVVQREKKGPQKGLRRPKRRVSIRIDMTPMVDIAFLLLIFYMVSTVFSMPQAMEINLPPKEEAKTDIEVKESNLLTIRVDDVGRYWWIIGNPKVGNLPQLIPSTRNKPDSIAYMVSSDSLRAILVNKNRENEKLSTLILINRKAKYNDMVSILDEIDYIERQWNQFTATKLNVKLDQIPSDQKFSYRYAMGEWGDTDDKIIEDAVIEARNRGQL